MKNDKSNNKSNKNNLNQFDVQMSGADTHNGFEDFALFDSMDGDYQFFDEMENFEGENETQKTDSDELLLVEPQGKLVEAEQVIEDSTTDIDKPIKIREIAVQSQTTKVNAFDLFFLRLWAGMGALLGYLANGINYIFNRLFKRKLPVRYIKAFLIILLVIIFLMIVIIPIASNGSTTSGSKDGLAIFECNMIPVKVRIDDGSGEAVYKWGYLNKKQASSGTGKNSLVIPAKYEEALPFNKYGIAWVRVRDDSGHYWELINKKGKRVGNRTYAVSSSVPVGERPFGEFTDSKLAWINENGKYGYIDIKGNVKIDCDLDVAGDFIDGVARVGRGNREWYINKNGKELGSDAYIYTQVLDFSCGLGAVKHEGRWGFVNKKGKKVIEYKYDAVSQFVDGYAMVKMGNTFGVIDTKGTLIINTQWYYDLVIVNQIFEEFLANHT